MESDERQDVRQGGRHQPGQCVSPGGTYPKKKMARPVFEPMKGRTRMTKPNAEQAPPSESNPFEDLVPGRIVHYWPTPAQQRVASPGPWPAMVTAVGEGGVLTLNVNLPSPTLIGEDPVQRMKDVPYAGDGEKGGNWAWIFPGQASRYKPA
jgi:hypothetical protein